MSKPIPSAVTAEHDEIQAQLAAAIRAGGRTADAARTISELMRPHLEAEEKFALPPLGWLRRLAARDAGNDAAEVIAMSERLRAELPRLLAEHRAIIGELDALAAAAAAEHQPAVADVARKLVEHATLEEQVMYPAAVLVGDYLRSLRRPPTSSRAPDAARFDLAAELETMRTGAPPRGGHLAKTLHRGPSLRLVLIAMDPAGRISEHRAEGATTIHVIDGRVRLRYPDAILELAPGEMVALEPDVPHSLDAIERTGVLLSIAWTGHPPPA